MELIIVFEPPTSIQKYLKYFNTLTPHLNKISYRTKAKQK